MPLLLTAVAVLLLASSALAQSTTDPFPTPIPATEGAITVSFREFAAIPDMDGVAPRMMVLVDEPGSRRLFVNDMRGPLYGVSYDGRTARQYVDVNAPSWGVVVQSGGRERGVQSFAFHPQFKSARHARLWKVLHVHRHGQHKADARLQAPRRHAHARHGASRMDREESGGRHV